MQRKVSVKYLVHKKTFNGKTGGREGGRGGEGGGKGERKVLKRGKENLSHFVSFRSFQPFT